MAIQSKFFTQHNFEFEMQKCISFGDLKMIAAELGVSEAMVSQYLNPNDDSHVSPVFRAAAFLAAWIAVNEKDGMTALAVFNNFVRRASGGDATLDLRLTRREMHREVGEFFAADANGGPRFETIDEGEQAIDAMQRTVDAMRAEARRAATRAMFPGKAVDHGIRAKAEKIIAGRNGRA